VGRRTERFRVTPGQRPTVTRIVHTGDTHVGYRQYHSPERRRDFLDAFEQVIADAVADDVDAVVHAGDLFHDRRPELPDLMGVLSVLRELDAAGVPFLAVVGNHESTRGGQWLDLFESLGLATRLGAAPTVVDETAFYGLDHVPASQREDLDYEFDPHDADSAALVAHGLFTPFAHGDWDTETVLQESTVAFDAVLLGDNHTPDTAEVEGTWVTYCGSTERASASERDGRGYNIVTFETGQDTESASDETDTQTTVDIRRRALDTREFVFVDAELGPGEGAERVRDRLASYDLADAVVLVDVTGEGEPVTPAEIESFATERGALVARVRDRREIETEAAEVSVDFADPDRAVRERLAEVELSGPAREIDDLVRDDAVVDSNLRDRVTERVRERLDAGTLVEGAVDGDASTGVDHDESSGVDGGDDGGGDDGGGDDESTETDSTDDESTDGTGDTGQLTMEDLT
jgi:DNA repair exonuclease SbcCD nuclease subunit